MEKEEKKVNEEENKKVNTENEVKQEVVEENTQSEIDELNDRYKRLFAEFENYKKRSQKERENLYGMITGDVVSKILPIMDNLENAANAKTEDTAYQEGVKLVMRQFSDALKSFNVEEIS